MGLFDRFPWVNTHDLNLDWIIQKMKEWGIESAGNVAAARTAAENAATNAANAVVGVAERAEAAADRAETAKTAAETAKTGAETAKTEAITAKTSAESNASKAEKAFKAASLSADGSAASAAEASRIESIVAGYAEDCNRASASARDSAAAAAQSAAQTVNFPYKDEYNGYIYKTLSAADTVTNDNREFLTAPQEAGTMYRVSGRIADFLNQKPVTVNHHYEKIIKIRAIPDEEVGTKFYFNDYILSSIDDKTNGLAVAECEVMGVTLRNKDESFIELDMLPITKHENGSYSLSKTLAIYPDLATGGCDIDMEIDLSPVYSPQNNIADLYLRVKYTVTGLG